LSSPPFAVNEGAKRKLTYADGSGTKFFETVVEVNGVDSIRLQLSEHPFPCEILYAHLSTERVDDDNCIFKVAAEYKLNDGIKPEAFEPGTLWLFQAIADGGAKVASKPETIRFALGQAWNPHRIMINHSDHKQSEWDSGKKMDVQGWKHYMDFWAFSTKQPGTIRIAVAQAWNPHRIMINHSDHKQSEWDSGKKMDVQGWAPFTEFWAYPTKQPGTIRIASGEAWNPHRLMINHSDHKQSEWDSGKKMDAQGWKHQMEFWVYPAKL